MDAGPVRRYDASPPAQALGSQNFLPHERPMETTLHRQLKDLYAGAASRCEIPLEGYRIDAQRDGQLVEIQQGSLSALKAKARALLNRGHRLLVVKPLASRTYLIRRNRVRGRIVSSRYSPRRQSVLELFDELVHFVDVFPHPRLTLEFLLIEQEEERVPARSPRSWRRRHRVLDRRLRSVIRAIALRRSTDLCPLLPADLPEIFSTADLAEAAEVPRWLAQKIAYCLRKTAAAQVVGKKGNALLYAFGTEAARAA